MNCRDAERQIFAARDGALEPTQRASLASHLEACAECRRMSENLETFAATLRAEDAAVRVPDANLEWRRLERTISGRNAGAKRSRIAWLAIPASLAGAAAIALYVGAGNREPSPNAAPQRMVARQAAAPVSTAGAPSTVVYVDDKSGWTFVWSSDSGGGRNI